MDAVSRWGGGLLLSPISPHHLVSKHAGEHAITACLFAATLCEHKNHMSVSQVLFSLINDIVMEKNIEKKTALS